MQIVISIPTFVYEGIRNQTEGKGIIEHNSKAFCDAIYNGIPLPKGHGRLIDENEITKTLDTWIKVCKVDLIDIKLRDFVVNRLSEGSTILEADTSGKE